MPKDAYYFSHDSNAKDDPKCSMLIEQLGLEGYGIYWVLVETLRDQEEYRYPLNMVPILARKYNTTAEKMRVVIGNYGLFCVDENNFFSESLCRRMQTREEVRGKKQLAGKRSGEIRGLLAGKLTEFEQVFNGCSTDVEQGKERKEKGKESIGELQKAIFEFVAFRRKQKKPMTDHAIDLLQRELDKLAVTDGEKIAILNQSILNGWQGVYPLKSQSEPKTGINMRGYVEC